MIIIIFLILVIIILLFNIENFQNNNEENNKFIGITYRLTNNWHDYVNLDEYNNKPIKYLEIGTFYGANLLSFANSYGMHNDSKLYCIDPWIDHEEYPEYKGEQNKIYNTFVQNIKNSHHKDKITIIRGYSNNEIIKFEDNFFDIIYIDGNHQPEYVLEDGVLSFRKLKINGIMIFDDYGWNGPDHTKKGIDAFLSAYSERITLLGEKETQLFLRKNK